MAAKAKYELNENEAVLHISKGNDKIGSSIWSFSTLPGNKEHMLYISDKDGGKSLLTDIPGTCGKYCENCAKDGACYAWRDAKLHHNVTIKAWGDNTLLLRNGRLWALLDGFLSQKNKKATEIIRRWVQDNKDVKDAAVLKKNWDEVLGKARAAAVIKMFRVHVAGEMEDLAEIKSWDMIARCHPEITFGVYTKNFDALGTYIDTTIGSKKKIPDNFVINVSEWHGIAEPFIKEYQEKYPGIVLFNVFEYDDSNKKPKKEKEKTGVSEAADIDIERLKAMPHCPAVDEKGKHRKTPDGKSITCDMCKRCYKKTGEKTAVYSH